MPRVKVYSRFNSGFNCHSNADSYIAFAVGQKTMPALTSPLLFRAFCWLVPPGYLSTTSATVIHGFPPVRHGFRNPDGIRARILPRLTLALSLPPRTRVLVTDSRQSIERSSSSLMDSRLTEQRQVLKK